MALKDARTLEDVAGIPGRLTAVFGRITAHAYTAWGASFYTALILLEARKIRPEIRSAMEIKYSPELVGRIEKLGIPIARLDIHEGDELGTILNSAVQGGNLADLFYTESDFAREGAIIITGRDAVEVAGIAVRLASAACYTGAGQNRYKSCRFDLPWVLVPHVKLKFCNFDYYGNLYQLDLYRVVC